MIVVDASAMTELLLQTELGRRVEGRLLRDEALHAPHLIDVDVASALRRLVRSGELAAERAEDAIEDLQLLLLARHGHPDLLPRAWEMREHVTATMRCTSRWPKRWRPLWSRAIARWAPPRAPDRSQCRIDGRAAIRSSVRTPA